MNQAVITGGKGELGQAIAATLQDSAWTVESPGRDELDVTDRTAIAAYFDQRPVELLVCNAGITRDALLSRSQAADWDDVMQVNFEGAAACATAVLAGMRERKSGHLVFISSNSAIHPPLGQVSYAAAKAGLLGLTKDLASRYGLEGIRVNAILPGFLETRMTEVVTQARRETVKNAHTLGRFNTVSEVAAFIRFLHFDLPHTSGQIFQLDSRC